MPICNYYGCELDIVLFQDDPIFLGTAGIVSSLPSLVKRWSEEARVLDGENVIECADVVKPFILPDLEEIRDRALKDVKKHETAEATTNTTAGMVAPSFLAHHRRTYRTTSKCRNYSCQVVDLVEK